MIGLGVLIGLATGYGAIACRWAIDALRELIFGRAGDISDLVTESGTPLLTLVLPAIGGLIVAPMVFYWAREAKGHGVPEVMEAISSRGGRIRPRVAVVKAIGSVITIATGGSVGWEGPIIQIGAGFGSTIGQVLKVARRRLRILVACGAAAGIAATFNAPIAGVIFSLEIFLGDLVLITFTPVVVAAVVATAVSYAHFGEHPVFNLAEHTYKLASVYEIPVYLLLGCVCAVGAVFFTRFVYFVEDMFDGLRVPVLLKPVLGGLGVGAIGIAMPQVLGVGYGTIGDTIGGNFSLQMLLALFVVKILATCLTIGSGGSGGIFAPALVAGALLGAGFGEVAHQVAPEWTAIPGVYAVVGMAAFVAGATHAPISAILILFEMTGDYAIILPLMIACVISSTVARLIFAESIYTLKLARRGITFRLGRDIAVLRSLTVGEVMRRDPVAIQRGAGFDEVRRQVLGESQHVYPVLGQDQKMEGIITLDELRAVLLDDSLKDVAIARDLESPCPHTFSPDDDLAKAHEVFAGSRIDEIPVLDAAGELVGMLWERDLRAAYQAAVTKGLHA